MSSAYSGNARFDTGTSDFAQLDFLARQVLNRTCTATLVRVESVDPEKMLADVRPLIGQIDGYGTIMPHGVIPNVPYLRLQGGGNAVIIDPVAGDIGLAVFAQHDISIVKKTKAAAGPGSRRKFDWTDAIYIGGLLNGAPTQFLRIGDDGITITSASGKPVTINAPGNCTITAPNATVQGSLTVTENLSVTGNATISGDVATGAGSTFNGKSFDSHTHGGVATGSGHSGAPD